eukprot:8462892-Pyramimonas_sp.AAC.2
MQPSGIPAMTAASPYQAAIAPHLFQSNPNAPTLDEAAQAGVLRQQVLKNRMVDDVRASAF